MCAKRSQVANASTLSSRNAALKQLLGVCRQGQSLSSLTSLTAGLDHRDGAFARLLSYGVLRYYHQLKAYLQPLLQKPLKQKDQDIELVLLMGIFQLLYTRVPDYAVVDAAVKQLRKSKKAWAARLVNGVLRSFLRHRQANSPEFADALQTQAAQLSHPQWIIERLKQDWPDCYIDILQANNEQAPMWLRINPRQQSTAQYQQQLESQLGMASSQVDGLPQALCLEQACDVNQLPGFAEGRCSVQDAGAQLAAQLLSPQPGDKILDACAAPGGKTAHLYECEPEIEVTAMDISAERLQRVEENAERLGFSPRLLCADASQVQSELQAESFQKILLDVPCSASGVIRRHPDIKLLRRADDIESLLELQRKILVANWELLAPGGLLLYATCSVFKAENQQQIEWFLAQQEKAELVPVKMSHIGLNWVDEALPGIQLLPKSGAHDGFYYALLRKAT